MKKEIKIRTYRSEKELACQKNLGQLFRGCPIPENELLSNLGLFLTRQTLSRILFINDLYKKILPVNGIVIEFGTRWGHNLVLFETLRQTYEPYNHTRKVVGFDTFHGFDSIHTKDGKSDISLGEYSTTDNYESYLGKLLKHIEQNGPLSHIKKTQVIKGDAAITIGPYLQGHPQTIIALAYFDMDLYEPTKKCLEVIQPYLTKGSIMCFDELNHPDFPGETIALKEVLGLSRYKIRRSPLSPYPSYIVIE